MSYNIIFFIKIFTYLYSPPDLTLTKEETPINKAIHKAILDLKNIPKNEAKKHINY